MFNKLIESPLLLTGARYGAIGAVLCMVFLISLYNMGRNPFLINPFLDPRIPVYVVMLLFMLKEVRDFYFQGTLYFWQGMIGAMINTQQRQAQTSVKIIAPIIPCQKYNVP